ncbi:MAG: phosphoribosylglycinamide formyltransferase [Clostridia bacterium]|nr:phosphoribosylglycinamide formyltransferase [Clostridia bacterium]
MVSGGGTNLQALIDAEKAGKIPHGHIVLVISNKADAYALERAAKAGIDTAVIRKISWDDQSGFEERIVEKLEEYGVKLIILAGFMCILSHGFTSRYPNRIINVHPSLIPSFCGKGYYGLKVHQKALEYGVKVTGAPVHFVNEIPDGGTIIRQKAVYIKEDDTPETLQRRVMEEAEWVILPEAAEQVCEEIIEKERG